jgi:hypothetical protein
MINLPFVVQPRRQPILEKIGTEDSGIIEVERRGYLTTGEKAFFQQVQQGDSGTSEIIGVARKIARRHSLGMDRAYNLAIAIISGSTTAEADKELVGAIEDECADDLTRVVQGLATSQVREDLVMACCMLRYRVDPNFDIESINKQHPDLIAALAALYRDEDRRSIEAFKGDEPSSVEDQPSVEEGEKKPTKVSKSRSTTTTGV